MDYHIIMSLGGLGRHTIKNLETAASAVYMIYKTCKMNKICAALMKSYTTVVTGTATNLKDRPYKERNNEQVCRDLLGSEHEVESPW